MWQASASLRVEIPPRSFTPPLRLQRALIELSVRWALMAGLARAY